jgi:hypothetical protein
MVQKDEDRTETLSRRGGLSRQDYFILVPAALSLATGTAILRNMIADDRVYEDRHRQVFSALQVRSQSACAKAYLHRAISQVGDVCRSS